jgi:tRNA pseudouridine38-40 synthase
MATYRLDMAYDGTRFNGWARQEALRTVQEEIEVALERLFGPVPVTVAGRTDGGVHALAQVASFSAVTDPPVSLKRALNALTPADIAILAAERAPDDFDARGKARSRLYRYRLQPESVPNPFERRYAVHWPYPLDREALDGCAKRVRGSHDFTAFTPTETEHVRFDRNVIEADWREEEPGNAGASILRFEIEADSFMRNMVRVLVGTMLEVGSGRRSLDDFGRLLEGRPRSEAGETAPARGLFLIGVRY